MTTWQQDDITSDARHATAPARAATVAGRSRGSRQPVSNKLHSNGHCTVVCPVRWLPRFGTSSAIGPLGRSQSGCPRTGVPRQCSSILHRRPSCLSVLVEAFTFWGSRSEAFSGSPRRASRRASVHHFSRWVCCTGATAGMESYGSTLHAPHGPEQAGSRRAEPFPPPSLPSRLTMTRYSWHPLLGLVYLRPHTHTSCELSRLKQEAGGK